MTHTCVGKLTIIASDNGLSPGRRQAIIWTNAGILLIGPLGTKFNGILIEIHTFSFKKMHLKMSSAKWRPFCLGLNVLKKTTLKCLPFYIDLDILMFPGRAQPNSFTSLLYVFPGGIQTRQLSSWIVVISSRLWTSVQLEPWLIKLPV